MSRVVQFDMVVDDPLRAIDFYQAVVGWKFEQRKDPEGDYWVIATGKGVESGIDGVMAAERIMRPPRLLTETSDIETSLKAVKASGGIIVKPRHALHNAGWSAVFQDQFGSQFGLLQADPSDK